VLGYPTAIWVVITFVGCTGEAFAENYDLMKLETANASPLLLNFLWISSTEPTTGFLFWPNLDQEPALGLNFMDVLFRSRSKVFDVQDRALSL